MSAKRDQLDLAGTSIKLAKCSLTSHEIKREKSQAILNLWHVGVVKHSAIIDPKK